MSEAIPYWRGDPDYFRKDDPRRKAHLRRIEINRNIDSKIAASSCFGDGSYSIIVSRKEID
jgi:hypothetical protein